MIKKLKRATQFCLKFQKSFVKRVTRGRKISGIINRRTNRRSHRDWNARFSNLDVPPRRWDWFKVVPFENSLTFERRKIYRNGNIRGWNRVGKRGCLFRRGDKLTNWANQPSIQPRSSVFTAHFFFFSFFFVFQISHCISRFPIMATYNSLLRNERRFNSKVF